MNQPEKIEQQMIPWTAGTQLGPYPSDPVKSGFDLLRVAEAAGFVKIKPCLPTKETYLADIGIDEKVLSKEWESDFSCPHTVIIEARKPSL